MADSLHEKDPVALAVLQKKHSPAPVSGWKDWTAQAVQVAEPAGAYLPCDAHTSTVKRKGGQKVACKTA